MGEREERGGDFLEETQHVWQRYSQQPLTSEDAREIRENIVAFFSVLIEWAEKDTGQGHGEH